MKKYLPSILLILTLCLAVSTSSAESLKVIKLKDGSTLKGNVLALNGGVYTLETENLGEIEIEESKILSISSPSVATTQSEASTATSNAQKSDLEKQVQQIQGTIMSDGDIMMDLKTLVEDEEIRKLLSDPNLMRDVTSYDQEKIEQNTNVQDLLKNPKIQQLMNKIQAKFPTQ